MSKLSFRARALDANKSLPVYHADDVPDLPDIASVNRVVPQMPTGMEKEEETVSIFQFLFHFFRQKVFAVVGQEGRSKLRPLIMRKIITHKLFSIVFCPARLFPGLAVLRMD